MVVGCRASALTVTGCPFCGTPDPEAAGHVQTVHPVAAPTIRLAHVAPSSARTGANRKDQTPSLADRCRVRCPIGNPVESRATGPRTRSRSSLVPLGRSGPRRLPRYGHQIRSGSRRPIFPSLLAAKDRAPSHRASALGAPRTPAPSCRRGQTSRRPASVSNVGVTISPPWVRSPRRRGFFIAAMNAGNWSMTV